MERIEQGVLAQARRGYTQDPMLAWALLAEARRTGASSLVERAVEVAPGVPSVRLEAARQRTSPADLIAAVTAMPRSLPAVLWWALVLGAAAGGGLLLATALLAGFGALRGWPLHGHSIGHAIGVRPLVVWPGVVLLAVGVAWLPALGLGPLPLLAVAGAIAVTRLPWGQSVALACMLALSGLALGPGLDRWTRLLALPSVEPALLSAWRVDWSAPLPGDVERLARAHAQLPGDPLYTLSLAHAHKHAGDLERAEAVLATLGPLGDDPASVIVHARAANLAGILRLAVADVTGALGALERARALSESATVLYNMSQAYGRNVELGERTRLYTAALEMDPPLVRGYAEHSGTSLHTYVVQEPLPLGVYLSRALARTPAASGLASRVRASVLGPALPAWGWMLLPAIALLALAAPRGSAVHCKRCDRPLCGRCAPRSGAAGACKRCDSLFGRKSRTDARVRQQQIELDRRRQIRARIARGVLDLALPGVALLSDGRAALGLAHLIALGAGAGLALAAWWVPVPFEATGMPDLAWLLAAVPLLAVYASGLLRARELANSKAAA
jgi:hypothetical protein